MQWRGRRGSGNIVDRRRMGGGGGIAVGGLGGFGLIAVLAIGYFLGIDVTPVLNGVTQSQGGGEVTAADEEAANFVSVVLADTEEVWGNVFAEQGLQYDPPKLVLFKGATQSACGGASAATGPFYCPLDKMVYLDTGFFTVLSQRLGANGDFAEAYVVAHEVGHAVQDRLGLLGQTQSNAQSVQTELQADCLSGVWAKRAEARFGSLDPGDVDEAMNAAAQIGDDTLQQEAGQRVRPESFTHGSSAQRQQAFAAGYEGGALQSCGVQ